MQSGVRGVSAPMLMAFNSKQCEFFYATHKYRHTAFFGGIRSGKTVAACIRGIDIALNCPGSRGVVIRETHVKLNDNTKFEFMKYLNEYNKKLHIIERKNDNENFVLLTNGSWIFFRHAHDEGLFKGPTYTWFLVDQAEEIDEEIAKLVCDRLSDPRYHNVGMLVGNTDRGHNWCYRWFKKEICDEDGNVTGYGEKPNSHLTETTFLDNIAYLQQVESAYVVEQLSRPQEEQDIYIFGSWDNPSGVILAPSPIHFVHDFEVPKGWNKYIACDPPWTVGTFGGLGWCIDYDGNFFYMREYYRENALVREHAEAVKRIWGGKESLMYFDPSSWKHGQGDDVQVSIKLVDIYRQHKLYPVAAENAISVGIELIREKARIDPNHQHPFTGRLGAPHLYFVKNRVPNLLEEMAGWMIDDPSKEPVHLCDCLRYSVASRPPVPVRQIYDDTRRVTSDFMAM